MELQKFMSRECRRYHPDRNPDKPDAEEKFKVLRNAVRVADVWPATAFAGCRVDGRSGYVPTDL